MEQLDERERNSAAMGGSPARLSYKAKKRMLEEQDNQQNVMEGKHAESEREPQSAGKELGTDFIDIALASSEEGEEEEDDYDYDDNGEAAEYFKVKGNLNQQVLEEGEGGKY